MILVDANLLVYARVSTMPQHETAHEWLDAQLNGSAKVGLPWPSLLAFLRLVTNPRIFEPADSLDAAWQQIEEWLACPTVWIPTPTDHHAHTLWGFIDGARLRSNLVPDAHLAALAIEHGLQLCSTDGDFARFPGLRWVNPLVAR